MRQLILIHLFLGLLLLLGAGGVAYGRKPHHHHNHNSKPQPGAMKASTIFEVDSRFTFHYDTQVSSGYAPWVSKQRAWSRFQADAHVQVKKSAAGGVAAVLWLQNPEDREFSEPIDWDSATIQSFEGFERKQRNQSQTEEFRDILSLPVEFNYAQGRVSKLRFAKEEEQWSKNIKKSVIAMLQVGFRFLRNTFLIFLF